MRLPDTCPHTEISKIRPVCLNCRETLPPLFKRYVVKEVVDQEVVFHSNTFEIADDWARNAALSADMFHVFQRFTIFKVDEGDYSTRPILSYQASFNADKTMGGRRRVNVFKRKERDRLSGPSKGRFLGR